jgi:hypothetical protein
MDEIEFYELSQDSANPMPLDELPGLRPLMRSKCKTWKV